MGEVLYRDESYRIIGCCSAVYNDKGFSFTEAVFHECLALEFDFRQFPFQSKPPFTLRYRGQTLAQTFEPDFVCFEKIIVEIKAVEMLNDRHRAQVINYLHAADYDLGLLVNFGSYPDLQHERLFHSRNFRRSAPADIDFKA